MAVRSSDITYKEYVQTLLFGERSSLHHSVASIAKVELCFWRDREASMAKIDREDAFCHRGTGASFRVGELSLVKQSDKRILAE